MGSALSAQRCWVNMFLKTLKLNHYHKLEEKQIILLFTQYLSANGILGVSYKITHRLKRQKQRQKLHMIKNRKPLKNIQSLHNAEGLKKVSKPLKFHGSS